MSDFERRRSVRVNVSLPVEVRDERGFSFHSTRDISATGCFFDRAIPHAVGARVGDVREVGVAGAEMALDERAREARLQPLEIGQGARLQ